MTLHRCFIDGKVIDLEFRQDKTHAFMKYLHDSSGKPYLHHDNRVEDHHDQFGVDYHMSDDGNEYYTILVRLKDNEVVDLTKVPSTADLKKLAMPTLMKLMEPDIYDLWGPENFAFFRLVLTSPEFILRDLMSNNYDLDRTFEAVLKKLGVEV